MEKRSDYENLPLAKIEWHPDGNNDIRRLQFTNKGGEKSEYPESVGGFSKQKVTETYNVKEMPISKIWVHY